MYCTLRHIAYVIFKMKVIDEYRYSIVMSATPLLFNNMKTESQVTLRVLKFK